MYEYYIFRACPLKPQFQHKSCQVGDKWPKPKAVNLKDITAQWVQSLFKSTTHEQEHI